MFRVRCKNCQNLFEVPDEKAGEPIHCPSCRNPIVIRPGTGKAAPVAAAVAAGKANTASPPALTKPRDNEDETLVMSEGRESQSTPDPSRRARLVEAVFVACRSCGQRMQVSTQHLGQVVQCQACKAVMKVDLPSVNATQNSTTTDEDDPLAPPAFSDPDLQNLRVTGSYARRRAHLRRGLGEKLIVGVVVALLMGGLVWMARYFLNRDEHPLGDRSIKVAAATPTRQNTEPAAPVRPVVDTYSWVDADNPVVWDSFLDATWGEDTAAMANLKPAQSPSKLFDTASLQWFQSTNPLKQVHGANLRSVLYGYVQEGGTLRLCEVRVKCQNANDTDTLREYLTEQYGTAEKDSPTATYRWEGKTSADRNVQIEIGGRTTSFNGAEIRASVLGIR